MRLNGDIQSGRCQTVCLLQPPACPEQEHASVQVVSKPVKRAQAKGHAPPRQQPANKAASQAGAPLYRRCPSMTSISDSTCSAESDQSMVTASSGVGSQAPVRQHHQQQQQGPHLLQEQQHGQLGPPRPAKPGSPSCTPPPGRPLKGPMQTGATVPKSRLAPPDLQPAAGAAAPADGAQQQHQQPQSWACRVAGTRPVADAKQAGRAASAQPSRADAPEAAAAAAGGAAGASPPCSEPGGSCSSSERSVATTEAGSEKAALAAEVGRLRSALAQSEAARQQEVAFLLQRAAEHEAAVSHPPWAVPGCL